jgi:hypothetical protein
MEKFSVKNGLIFFRQQWVILDFQLASLYGMPVEDFTEIILKYKKRFGNDELQEVPLEEWKEWKKNLFSLYKFRKRFVPLAFNEDGVRMLFRIFTDEKIMKKSLALLEKMVSYKNTELFALATTPLPVFTEPDKIKLSEEENKILISNFQPVVLPLGNRKTRISNRHFYKTNRRSA